MANGGPDDPTISLPEGERRGAPRPDSTRPGGYPGAFDPTVAVPAGPGGPGGPGGPRGPYGPAGDGNSRWLWAGLSIVGVIVLGVLVALLLSDGGDDDRATTASSTTSSSTAPSTSTTSSTSSTTTTTPSGPQITAYNATPNPATCPNNSATVQLTLTWTTTNALGVTVSIDGPGKYADYGANGSAQVPFNCSGTHSYTLTANGSAGQTTSRTITVQPAVTPPSTTPPTTAVKSPTTTTS
jgi:hypothetical protein